MNELVNKKESFQKLYSLQMKCRLIGLSGHQFSLKVKISKFSFMVEWSWDKQLKYLIHILCRMDKWRAIIISNIIHKSFQQHLYLSKILILPFWPKSAKNCQKMIRKYHFSIIIQIANLIFCIELGVNKGSKLKMPKMTTKWTLEYIVQICIISFSW